MAEQTEITREDQAGKRNVIAVRIAEQLGAHLQSIWGVIRTECGPLTLEEYDRVVRDVYEILREQGIESGTLNVYFSYMRKFKRFYAGQEVPEQLKEVRKALEGTPTQQRAPRTPTAQAGEQGQVDQGQESGEDDQQSTSASAQDEDDNGGEERRDQRPLARDTTSQQVVTRLGDRVLEVSRQLGIKNPNQALKEMVDAVEKVEDVRRFDELITAAKRAEERGVSITAMIAAIEALADDFAQDDDDLGEDDVPENLVASQMPGRPVAQRAGRRGAQH